MCTGHDLELVHVTKRYGDTVAVRDVSHVFQPGSYVCLLGPSGCGKSSTLRMIAGHESITEGQIVLDGVDVSRLPPARRGTAMMFQSYALFPHLSVRDNVAFSLRMQGVDKPTRHGRADDLLALVHMTDYADRLPAQLSGGQQQRVALARALITKPKVLLLDEPLSALDLKLRQHMRAELRALQKRTGVTFIYITHDQSEALAMSDRVAVMSAGVLQQVGAPRDLYESPRTPFVASFVGETNAISGTVVEVSDTVATIETAHGRMSGRSGEGLKSGGMARLYVRPEALVPGLDVENRLTATIERSDFEGAFALLHGRLSDGSPLVASVGNTALAEAPAPGESAVFGFETRHAVVLADG